MVEVGEEEVMGTYRKKPVTVEACRYDGTEASVHEFLDRDFKAPFANPDVIFKAGGGECLISTLEGVMKCNPGDWIIRGVKGELYPCKSDIFEATYEEV